MIPIVPIIVGSAVAYGIAKYLNKPAIEPENLPGDFEHIKETVENELDKKKSDNSGAPKGKKSSGKSKNKKSSKKEISDEEKS